MTRKNVYVVPECEPLYLELEEDFLGDSTFPGGKAEAEDAIVDDGYWD